MESRGYVEEIPVKYIHTFLSDKTKGQDTVASVDNIGRG